MYILRITIGSKLIVKSNLTYGELLLEINKLIRSNNLRGCFSYAKV
jgi:hypothetical protein